jgi:hypothetical protein
MFFSPFGLMATTNKPLELGKVKLLVVTGHTYIDTNSMLNIASK